MTDILIYILFLAVGLGIGFFIARLKYISNLKIAEVKAAELAAIQNEYSQQAEKMRALEIELAQYMERLNSSKEKEKWAEQAEKQLQETFEALSSRVLKESTKQMVDRTSQQTEDIFKLMKSDWNTRKEEFKGMVDPLGKNLEKMEKQVNELEKNREGAYKGLLEQIGNLERSYGKMEDAANGLTRALKSPTSRGRWGEVQLQRIVEMAGLVNHVDFDLQETGESGRPDMVVHLPKQGIIPVDAKAPMKSYLEASEAATDEERKDKLMLHAKAVRTHMKELSKKAYWDQFKEQSPEFVTMVIPYESGLSAAFNADPALLEDALKNKVLIVSPVTLLALLKVVSYGWMQLQMADNARKIADTGKLLYDRFLKFNQLFMNVGKRLNSTVSEYNKAVGSMKSRLLPSANRLKDMGTGTEDLPEINLIETAINNSDLSEV